MYCYNRSSLIVFCESTRELTYGFSSRRFINFVQNFHFPEMSNEKSEVAAIVYFNEFFFVLFNFGFF